MSTKKVVENSLALSGKFVSKKDDVKKVAKTPELTIKPYVVKIVKTSDGDIGVSIKVQGQYAYMYSKLNSYREVIANCSELNDLLNGKGEISKIAEKVIKSGDAWERNIS